MIPDTPYQPISCDFHDILEATATRRAVARIVFLDEDGHPRRLQARILDLVTRDDGEYMQLDSGETVRFDRIVSVDDARLSDFPAPDRDDGTASTHCSRCATRSPATR